MVINKRTSQSFLNAGETGNKSIQYSAITQGFTSTSSNPFSIEAFISGFQT